MERFTPLVPGQCFHIFNRGNNRENLFREKWNYERFLRLYSHHIFPVADTYAYCLLKNHFHFLVRLKDDLPECLFPAGFSKPFSNFFNAYARSFNIAYGRSGALFQRPFGRVPVEGRSHLIHSIVYVHQNPQRHGFVKDFRDWPYSSFHVLVSNHLSFVERGDVMKIFGSRQRWRESHEAIISDAEMAVLTKESFR
ncbi:MAG: hypothetical protein JW929_06770 [Anaerolineales bacterium]|nr:hypothetical protein [Anaerolineales bacterium]